MELITCSEQRGDLASVWGLPGEVGTHEADAADKAKLGDVPAWRAKRVSELQGKVVRILDDSDEEPPQKRLREAPRTPPRRVATSQPTPEFVRLQRGTTMELSPSFYEELHAVRAEAEAEAVEAMATSARGAELAEATGVAVVEMVEKEAAAAEVAVAEKAELAERAELAAATEVAVAEMAEKAKLAAATEVAELAEKVKLAAATEVAVAEMAEKAKPAADTEAVAEMAETDLAAALEMAAAERSELAEAMGVAVAAEKDLAPATEVAVTESLLAAAAADDRATQALGARPGGSRTNTIAYTKEPVFLAEVANKVCADLLAPSELDAASSSKALAETTLSKAQTQLKKRLGPKAAKKSKAKTAAQPKAKPKAKPKAMPTPYVMKRHKRKHFTAFAINLDKQIMQAQSNQINNAEALVADLTAKLNNEAIAVQEAISELTAAKARGG
ncbi:unnamed protein product [Effrenium voratum]|nr:unnamed protein product [Effrenium voratum]